MREPDTVTTLRCFPAAPEQVWGQLRYYEQIEEPAPWLLRQLLPTPVRTVGPKSAVGDEARCEYVAGHLIKRITELEPGRLYAFLVVEQRLPIGGIELVGGSYTLTELEPGRTEVALVTRYTSDRTPRWLWRPVEARVCHALHEHILSAMARALAPAPLPVQPTV